MKTHTKTQRLNILLGLLVATATLAGASVFSTLSNSSAALIRTTNDPKAFFESVKVDPGCSGWLVHQHTGPTMTFWNPDKTVALTQTGTSLTRDLKLTVPAGNYIKYIAYGGSDSHAMNVKLTDTNNQQVGGWYIFSAVKNKSPYRYDASVDSNTAVNVYFKAGHLLQSFNFLAVSYCPVQMSSSSVPAKANLAITSETSPSNVELRADFTHEVVIKNTGILTASDVKLNVPIPRFEPISYFIFSGTNNTNCLYGQTGMIVCDLKSIAAGETKTIQIKFRPTDESSCNKTTLPASVSVIATNAPSVTGTIFSHTVNCTSTNPAFTIGISGPATQTYLPGAQDVVMANVTMYAGTADVLLRDLFIAVQGTKYAYGNLTGVELRSKLTGQTIPGIIPDNVSSTWRGRSTTVTPPYYTIYRFDDVSLYGQDTYEFRADIGNSLINDNFRIHICGESRYMLDRGSVVLSPSACDFGGLVSKSAIYQMDIVETPNNSPVADVRPRGTISGNTQIIKSNAPLRGNLYISVPTTSFDRVKESAQLVAGTPNSTAMLRLLFRSDNEDVEVTRLVITSTWDNNALNDIDRIELRKLGEMDVFATATVGGCTGIPDLTSGPGTAPFCAILTNKNLVIPKDQSVNVIATAVLKSDDMGSISGSEIVLVVNSGPEAVKARGMTTQSVLPYNNSNATAEGEVIINKTGLPGVSTDLTPVPYTVVNQIVHSKIASVVNNGFMPPNGTVVPSGRANIGGFTITAAQNSNTKNGINKVSLKKLQFIVQAVNVLLSTDSVLLKNPVGNDVQSPCTVSGGQISGNTVTGRFTVTCNDIAPSVGGNMAPGEYINLYLSMEILNNKIANTTSSLQVNTDNWTLPFTPIYSYMVQNQSVEWFDKDNFSSTLIKWMDLPSDDPVYSTLFRS